MAGGQYVTLLDANGQPANLTASTTVVSFPAVQVVSATALPLPDNAAQEAGGHLASVDAKLTASAAGLKIDGSGVTQPVSGTVAVSNFPASQTVTVANFPGSQPITGPVSQGAAGAAAWKVDGSGVTQPVAGTVTVSNFPGTQPVSGAVTVSNLPATQTVAGTVAVSNLPATQPVSGSVSVANFPVDTAGSLTVNFEGRKQSYRCAVVGGTPIASATAPTFSISGSASKVIRVTKIGFSASAATGTACDAIVRRFSALTGGTSATQAGSIAKLDTSNAAATALVSAWSAAATTATSAGVLASQRYEIVTAGVSTQPGAIFWLFGDNNSSALVLRGTSDSVGVCLSAVGTTPTYDVWVEWTEE